LRGNKKRKKKRTSPDRTMKKALQKGRRVEPKKLGKN